MTISNDHVRVSDDVQKMTSQTESAETVPMKYWAYISYSSHDLKLAKRLRDQLEDFSVPMPQIGKIVNGYAIPNRLKPVFLDRDELVAGPDLPQRIRVALEESRYLIVVSSPHSKCSDYVGKEIQWFNGLGRSDRIISYIVEGDPPECFHKELLYERDEQGTHRRPQSD